MNFRLALIAIIALAPACKRHVIRDAEVYTTELAWFQQAGEQTASLSSKLVERVCVCEDGYFVDPVCEDLADNIVTIMARMAWHVAMSRYNAGITEERPPDPPEIPPAESLCPEGED